MTSIVGTVPRGESTLAAERRPSDVGCGHQTVLREVDDAPQQHRGNWRRGGTCGQSPATQLVREHCIRCERIRVSHWCDDCVTATQHWLGEQQRIGYAQALSWCLGCEQFGVQLEVTA